MDHFDSMLAALRQTVFGSLACEAAPVRLALMALFGDQAEPVRALALDALAGDASSLRLGAAIELIDAGLRRLHGELDQDGSLAEELGAAAAVLTGDYLTSGAFKLLVEHGQWHGMQVVALAAVQASQAEAAAQAQLQSRGAVEAPPVDAAWWLARHRSRAEPLGQAAGESGAALAGLADESRTAAVEFGGRIATAQSLLRAARAGDDGSDICLRLCHDELDAARRLAERLEATTSNRRPGLLCDWLQLRIDPVRPLPASER